MWWPFGNIIVKSLCCRSETNTILSTSDISIEKIVYLVPKEIKLPNYEDNVVFDKVN